MLIGYDSALEPQDKYTYIINAFSMGLVLLFFVYFLIYVKSFVVNLFTTICLLDLLFVFYLLNIRKMGAARILLLLAFFFQEFFLVFFGSLRRLTSTFSFLLWLLSLSLSLTLT